jgi:hypothetical protein
MDTPAREHPVWSDLLRGAVEDPGRASAAYSNFWPYSFRNQLLAMEQCLHRALPIGPIASYRGWLAHGRQVRKGEKALSLWMPIHRRGEPKPSDEAAETARVRFVFLNRWFVYAQTDRADGATEDWAPLPVPGWDRGQALSALQVREVAFDSVNGNVQGWSVPADRTLALNPAGTHPVQTTFHELGHIVLDHVRGHDDAGTAEVEAECVALLATATLTPTATEALAASRHYVQWYIAKTPDGLTEEMSRRIMSAANQVLVAGRVQENAGDDQAA